jgi:hypothetical protein
MMDELIEGEVVNAEIYPPFYIAAAGAHFLNMANKIRKFHWRNRKPMDLRVHPILAAPPGFSKSFFIHQMMEMPYGLLTKTGVELIYQQSVTAAGWIGTASRTRDGEVKESIGEAQEHKFAIFGCEEFQGLFTKSSTEMIDALLQTLDDGHLVKRVAADRLDYQTYITLFGGAQIDHFNLSRGLFRRLTAMVFIPTKSDQEALFEAYFTGGGRRYNARRLKKIRIGYKQRVKSTRHVKQITMSDKFETWARKRRIIHYELPVYERLIIGYNIMRKPPNSEGVLNCTIDKTLLNMIKNQYKWRKMLKKDLRENMIMQRVMEEGEMKVGDLFLQMADLGLELDKARPLVDSMFKRGLLFATEEGKIRVNIGEG